MSEPDNNDTTRLPTDDELDERYADVDEADFDDDVEGEDEQE